MCDSMYVLTQGVLYSHRSNFLHALIAASKDVLNLGSNSCFCALVPLFHANSWGLVFAAPMMGARLVLPGDCPFPCYYCCIPMPAACSVTGLHMIRTHVHVMCKSSKSVLLRFYTFELHVEFLPGRHVCA